MREIRLHGSEGGEAQDNGPSLPLSFIAFLRRYSEFQCHWATVRRLGMADIDRRLCRVFCDVIGLRRSGAVVTNVHHVSNMKGGFQFSVAASHAVFAGFFARGLPSSG